MGPMVTAVPAGKSRKTGRIPTNHRRKTGGIRASHRKTGGSRKDRRLPDNVTLEDSRHRRRGLDIQQGEVRIRGMHMGKMTSTARTTGKRIHGLGGTIRADRMGTIGPRALRTTGKRIRGPGTNRAGRMGTIGPTALRPGRKTSGMLLNGGATN